MRLLLKFIPSFLIGALLALTYHTTFYLIKAEMLCENNLGVLSIYHHYHSIMCVDGTYFDLIAGSEG